MNLLKINSTKMHSQTDTCAKNDKHPVYFMRERALNIFDKNTFLA